MEPLLCDPWLRPMVWGGRRLGKLLDKHLPAEQSYGESWEVSDHAMHRSIIANAPWRGHTLRQIMEQQREELLGPAAAKHEIFPWLIKFLDAHDWLSVQVHPDENAVKRLLPGENSKTEAWFILHAEPCSRIYAGLREGADEQVMRDALAKGTAAECLHSFEPAAGDFIFLPAGTVHAVGGGIVMAEVQQTSDATFRLFDWNRRDAEGKSRQLHIEESIASIHWDKGPVQPVRVDNFTSSKGQSRNIPLVDCKYFTMEYVEHTGPFSLPQGNMQTVIVAAGRGELKTANSEYPLETGQVWIVPARCPRVQWVPDESLSLVVARLPAHH